MISRLRNCEIARRCAVQQRPLKMADVFPSWMLDCHAEYGGYFIRLLLGSIVMARDGIILKILQVICHDWLARRKSRAIIVGRFILFRG